MSKIKIVDGDLIFIRMEGSPSAEYMERVRGRVEQWLKSKNLSNVQLIIAEGKITVDVLSVNDVFEESVLKGD